MNYVTLELCMSFFSRQHWTIVYLISLRGAGGFQILLKGKIICT